MPQCFLMQRIFHLACQASAFRVAVVAKVSIVEHVQVLVGHVSYETCDISTSKCIPWRVESSRVQFGLLPQQ